MSRTNLQILGECDNFPYPDEGRNYNDLVESLFTFSLLRSWSSECQEHIKVGFIRPEVVDHMPWLEHFYVNHKTHDISITFSNEATESMILRDQLLKAREQGTFAVLRGWRNELYPIFGVDRDIRIERAGSALFGILTIGVHMTGYIQTSDNQLKVWVPRRAKTKQTYGGMLDNTVAGGIAAGEDQFECIIREAGEEASLPEDFVRHNAKPCGTISYFHIRDERAGGESGLLQPETQYVYDIEMPESMVPKPSDNEVEEFYLWSINEVKTAIGAGQFKPNCSACLIDFLIRHGEISANDEKDYLEIMTRLHRRIHF